MSSERKNWLKKFVVLYIRKIYSVSSSMHIFQFSPRFKFGLYSISLWLVVVILPCTSLSVLTEIRRKIDEMASTQEAEKRYLKNKAVFNFVVCGSEVLLFCLALRLSFIAG